MPKLDIKNIGGEIVGTIELDDAVFAGEINEHLLWESVKWQQAKKRSGTHCTKTRGEVRGTKAKPHKQKGTGRARAGSRRSPVWVGGGIVFGPRPRSYEYTMPRKARRSALRSVLSLRVGENKLVIVDEFPAEQGKTRQVSAALKNLGATNDRKPAQESALIVDDASNESLVRGTRNLARSKWLPPEGLNVYDVLNHETLIMTKDCAQRVQEALRS